MAKVICFVDGLPFYHKGSIDSGLNLSSGAIVPGLGFSSNQHCYLLGGKSPDDMGFFTDWTKVENTRGSRFYLNHKYTSAYLANKVFGKIFGYGHSIPIGLHSVFVNNSVYPLKNIETLSSFNSLFEDWDFFIDDLAIEYLDKRRIRNNSFLVINSIDKYGHYSGPKSATYMEELNNILTKLRYLTETEEVELLLFSDHGMSNNPKPVDLYLEDSFGRQGKNSYFYFIDSTTLKVWCSDKSLLKSISDHLAKLHYGVLLSEEDRCSHGIINENFGDLIFVLKNDWYFRDQYFGKGWKSKTKGMHGNWPDHIEQLGMYAMKGFEGEEVKTKDFYRKILMPFLTK